MRKGKKGPPAPAYSSKGGQKKAAAAAASARTARTAAVAEPRHWIRIHMLSDWHVGSGEAARGDLDSFVVRDADGFPCIPSATLKGILRDAAEHVAHALDDGTHVGAWQKYVQTLFGDEPALPGAQLVAGSPRMGRIDIGEAQFTHATKAMLGTAPLKRALVYTKAGVKIDDVTLAAAKDNLRFDEVARRRSTLFAGIAFRLEQNEQPLARALIVAACAVADRLGGNRRRGLGKCNVKAGSGSRDFTEWDRLAAVSLLRNTQPSAVLSTANLRIAGDFTPSLPGSFDRTPFIVSTLEPVVVGGAVEANVVTGLGWMPGSSLLAVVANALRVANPGDESRINAAIANGDIRVAPAYPMIDEQRAAPVPQIFQVDKTPAQSGDVREVFNLILAQTGHPTNAQRKGLRTGFLTSPDKNGHAKRIVGPRLISVTHNAIDDEVQRPTARVIGVYSYEGIAPKQELASFLEMRIGLGLKSPFACEVHAKIGRARGRGYGGIVLSRGPGPTERRRLQDFAVGQELTVLFKSDAILLDAALQPTTTPENIVTALGLAGYVDPNASKAFIRTVTPEAWIARWNMPRAGILAVGAGSVLAMKVTTAVTEKILQSLMQAGIGLRKAEGFGQISFDDPLTKDIITIEDKDAATISGVGGAQLYFDNAEFVKVVQEEAWRAWAAADSEMQNAHIQPDEHSKFKVKGGEARKFRGSLAVWRRVTGTVLASLEDAQIASLEDARIGMKRRADDVKVEYGITIPDEILREGVERLVLTALQIAHRATTSRPGVTTSAIVEDITEGT